MLKFLCLSSLLVCFVIGAPQDPLDRTRWNRYEKFGGNQDIERNIRIVGGSQAQPNQFQHAVALYLSLMGGQDSFCGGSIISANFILTAAHCLDDLISLEVNAGMTNLFRSNVQYRARVRASDCRQHERYNRDLLNDDIGLVRLRTPITFTSSMRAVALPSRALPVNANQNSNPFIIGWGRTSDASQSLSNTLQFAQLPVIADSNCVAAYNKERNYFNPQTNICISGSSGSTCNGDSGGSATIVSQGVHTLIGIVSFGSYYCEAHHPVALVRITAYLDWINARTQLRA